MERVASSIRGLNQRYGVGRGKITEAIRLGELPATRLGPKRIVVLHSDFEGWLRSHAVRPTDFAAGRVAEVLAREARATQDSGTA